MTKYVYQLQNTSLFGSEGLVFSTKKKAVQFLKIHLDEDECKYNGKFGNLEIYIWLPNDEEIALIKNKVI